MPESTAAIAVLILERPTCLECIAEKADMTVTLAKGYLARLVQAVTVEYLPDERCRTCGSTGTTLSIGRD